MPDIQYSYKYLASKESNFEVMSYEAYDVNAVGPKAKKAYLIELTTTV